MRKTSLLFAYFLLSGFLFAQKTAPQPKLIVGIVVDQMRYDFLYRFRDSYGPGGFKRLISEGFSCENTHYNYAPTYTGPGHAAIYTGTTPAVNGIIANDWWDIKTNQNRYVTSDNRYKTIGNPGDEIMPSKLLADQKKLKDRLKVGQQSPDVMLSSTVTDELLLSNNFKSKVVGICLKDRGSILPAGHKPDAAYWFDDFTGHWITSDYYTKEPYLPNWVQQFNNLNLPDTYISKGWEKIKDQAYEPSPEGYKQGRYYEFPAKMPYNLTDIKTKKDNYGVIRFTPFGTTLTLDFAREAIQQMELGKDQYPDFLCISFSSPDYCGHQFGLHAEEMQDMYLKLDQEIAAFLKHLDEKVGKDNVLVFLTADHGAVETPAHMNDLNIPAGVFEEKKIDDSLELVLKTAFGVEDNYIHSVSNQQIWLNKQALADHNIKVSDASETIIAFLKTKKGVYDAFTRAQLMQLPPEYPFVSELRRGIHPSRSGDIIFQLDPGWHADDDLFKLGGTTHGSSYPYDTHVPLLWYGWNIKPGISFAPVSITDIAPTLSAMLRIVEPNGCTGKIIEAVVR